MIKFIRVTSSFAESILDSIYQDFPFTAYAPPSKATHASSNPLFGLPYYLNFLYYAWYIQNF